MKGDSADGDLLERLRAGDSAARETVFAQHRERLRKMVQVRLDPAHRPKK